MNLRRVVDVARPFPSPPGFISFHKHIRTNDLCKLGREFGVLNP